MIERTEDAGPVSSREVSSSNVAVPNHEGMKVDLAVVILRPLRDCYGAVHDIAKLVTFIPDLDNVTPNGDGSWHLSVGEDLQKPIEWNIKVITDEPDHRISWTSTGNGDIATAGTVLFLEMAGGRGTEVRVILKYDMPNEFIKTGFVKIFGRSPEAEVKESLRRFKSYLETGEIPTIEGQPRGPRPVTAKVKEKMMAKVLGRGGEV